METEKKKVIERKFLITLSVTACGDKGTDFDSLITKETEWLGESKSKNGCIMDISVVKHPPILLPLEKI